MLLSIVFSLGTLSKICLVFKLCLIYLTMEPKIHNNPYKYTTVSLSHNHQFTCKCCTFGSL